MNRKKINGIIRHLATTAGGALMAVGQGTGNVIFIVGGGILFLAGGGASIAAKEKQD